MSRFSRFCVLFLATAFVVLACAAPAFAAAPNIKLARYTNPIASELKSLQVTHFYTRLDQRNVWAVLKVGTQFGDKYIYKGPIADATNTLFWFPAWNGKGPNGERLPSSGAYRWTLTVSKAGESTSTSGLIPVAKIYVGIHVRSNEADLKTVPTFDAKMTAFFLKGNFNAYVSAVSLASPSWTPPTGTVEVDLNSVNPGWGTTQHISTGQIIRMSTHVDGVLGVPYRGLSTFEIDTDHPADMIFTVIQ